MTSVDGSRTAILAKITLKDRTDFSTQTLYIGNQAFNTLEVSGFDVLPIMTDISPIANSVGESVPEKQSGSITVANTRGTYTRDQKFFDLTIRYAIELQPIEIMVWNGQVGDLPTSFEPEFKGKVVDLQQNGNGTCTIRFDNDLAVLTLEQTRINKQIAPDAPERSLGKYLPWVFGQAEAPLYSLDTSTSATDPKYAYASIIPTNFQFTESNNNLLAQGFDNKWYEVAPTGGTWVAVSEVNTGTYSDDATLNEREFASTVQSSTEASSTGYIFTHVAITFMGNNTTGNVTGSTTASLYLIDESSGLPNQRIASGSIQNSDYETEIEANAEFEVVFAFDRAVAVSNPGVGLAVGVSVRLSDDTSDLGPLYRVVGASAKAEFYKEGGAWYTIGSGTARSIELYGANWSFSNDTSGKMAIATLDQYDEPPSWEQSNPDISNLNLVKLSDGIEDTQGSFTPSANDPIDNAWYIANFLLQDSDGSFFDAYNAETTLTATVRRKSQGITSSKQLPRTILSEVCANAASKLLVRKTGNYAMWSYGYESNLTYPLNEQDVELVSVVRGSAQEIVNWMLVAYDETFTQSNDVDLKLDQPRSMRRASEYSYEKGIRASEVAYKSFQTYGRRPLSDNYNNLRYVKDVESAHVFADYTLRKNWYPRLIATINLPYWRDAYRNIELTDKIDVSHIDNPSFAGTATRERVRNPTVEGELIGDFWNDYTHIWRYAQRFPFRVMRKEVRFDLASGNGTLTLVCMVLDNPDEIT